MVETGTYNGPKDKKPKWQVKPFNFAAVKKIGQDNAITRTEPKAVKTETKREDPIVNDPVPVTEEPKLGMGDLKQAESEGTVNFFDQKPPRNINDLYQTKQDATKAPVYDYKKLENKPITKKVYKERINNPENREPTYPISQPVETPSGSYEAKDIEPELQAQEIQQKTEIINKINSGEINLPPFVSSLPIDMQLGYVGATYSNNPLYTSLTTLMEPLLHLDNIVRSGMNKAFSTDYKMLTPPNMSGEDEDDKLITGGTELLTALIPLGASIKGANYLLQGIKNPFIKKLLGTGLGFVINSQPALLDNLQQGNMELKDYAAQTATDFVTGITFGALPPGTPLKYDLPFQTIVPTMVPVISDLIMGKEVNEKELVSGFLSNAVLSLVMSGQLSKNTKVKEVVRQAESELNKYDESQRTPELVNQIIAGLLPPAREQNTETISRVKPGETKQVPKEKSTLDKLLRRDPGTQTVSTKPTIEQITIPGDRSRIVVDESGTAKVEPEAEQQGYIAPIKLTAEQYQTMKNNGMTDAEIKEAQNNLNKRSSSNSRLPVVYKDVIQVDSKGNAQLVKGNQVTDYPVTKAKKPGMTPEEIQKAKENLNKPAYPTEVKTESVQTEKGQDNRITPEGVNISADPRAQIDLKTEEARVNADLQSKYNKEKIDEITNPNLVNSQSSGIKDRVDNLNEAIREHNKQFDPVLEPPAPKPDGRADQLQTVNDRINELMEESKTANKNERRKISERIERLQEQRDILEAAIKNDSVNKTSISVNKVNDTKTDEVRQDNGITPEVKPETVLVKPEPEKEYKTVTIDKEDYGKKFVADSKGNKFIVKKEKGTDGTERYYIYKKGPNDKAPEQVGKYMSEYSVNLGLRAWAEGDMRVIDRPPLKQEAPAVKKEEVSDQEKKWKKAYDDMLDLRDEVNNVKSSDLGGRANKQKNIIELKKAVDTYTANHPDNKAKIERTKYGTYNITINGKPLRRESVKREFDPEAEAGNIDNPNAIKSFKELGAEERDVQRKIAENIIETGPALVKEKAKFDTPVKVLRKGLEDIREDSGKEQTAEAKIVREEMLSKTDNGAEYRAKKETGQDNGIKEPERRNIFEKMTLPQLEKHIEDRVKEFKSRVDYFQSAEYKEIIKPLHDKLLHRQGAEVKKQVEYEKEKLKNKIITKEQYDKAIQNIKDRGRNMYTTPIDPAALKDIMVVGLYHFEQGARTLASWSKKMVKELGDKVKPYLKEVYKGINIENKDRVFHGTKDLGDNPILKRDVEGNSIIPEGIFVTHSLSYAERYKVNEVDDNHKLIPGKIYETKIKKNNDIFDATNPKHIDKLLDGFKQQLKDGEYDSMEEVMSDYNNARRYIRESIHKGALDWGVGTEYLEQIEKAGFKGAKLLERPAEDITENADGSYNLKGDPIYSYALFKDTPVKSANTVSKESKDSSLDNINNPKRNKLSHQIPWDSEYNTTLDNMTKNVPSDFYTHPEYYADMKDRADRESWQVIKGVKGKPNAEVTIYRAVPKGVSEISAGDWVSLSKTYAKDHGKHHEDKSLDLPVISKKVRVDEVIWDSNSINEFAYYSKEVQRIVSSESYKKAVEEIRKLPDKAGALPIDYYAKNIKNLATIGLYHFESGLRKFGDWAKKMVKELGEKIKPHLKKIWSEINNPKNVKAFRENNPDAELYTSGPSMKLKNEETFEQYKKRIAKEYGKVPTREEYNDAKQLKITEDKVQEKNDVKTELEGVLNDVVNAPAKQRSLDEMRSRTSKKRNRTDANGVYMDKVYEKMNEIKAEMEKKGYKGQALMNQSEIQSVNHVFNNDPEFKKFNSQQKKAIVREIKNFYKEEYRKQTAANAVLGEEYQDKNIWDRLKKSSFLQSLTHIGRQGESGKEMATRFKQMADEERMWMGEPSGLLLDIEGLSKAEKNNLEKIWEAKMNEQIPMNYMNDNVKNVDAKINDYFERMAGEYKDRGFVTRNLLTGDIYAFTPKRDYRPRMLNDKIKNLEVKEDSSGIPKPNAVREKVIDFLIETKQAKDRAGAAILLDNELSKHRIRKAGNVEYSRNEKIRLPDEYYISDPSRSLIGYAKKVSKRMAFVDAWGMEGQIFNRLRDDLFKQGHDYQRANDLFRYETGQLTAKERQSIQDVNNIKSLMALTKFSPFTSLRNAFQGFLGSTTRGNLKAGFSGLINSLSPAMRKHAYEAGVMADNLEGVLKEAVGGGDNNFLNKMTGRYLDMIQFTSTDRYNRIISAVGGLSFMEDMLKRIQKDSVWKKRAQREFKKLNIDPEKVIENGGYTKAEKDKIMRTFAFDTQFSLRPQDLPLWWSSPHGKLVTQWKPWGYKMTQLIRDNVIKEVKHGNVMPLVTMLTAYGVTGEAVNYIIDNIRSVSNFNPKDDKNQTPNERSLPGQIESGNIEGITNRVISDLAGLGALSLYWDIMRSFGYAKYGEGLSVVMGPAFSEASSIVSNVFNPTFKKLAMNSEDTWEEVTKKTIKGLFKTTAGNAPGAGFFRTLGMTKALEDKLFKQDGPSFKDDSVIGDYYKGLDDPGKEEVKKIKEMEKDLKAFKDQVLNNPTKEMQREYQKKESEIKKYKDKSRVWYNYTKLKSTKEKEESKKLGK